MFDDPDRVMEKNKFLDRLDRNTTNPVEVLHDVIEKKVLGGEALRSLKQKFPSAFRR